MSLEIEKVIFDKVISVEFIFSEIIFISKIISLILSSPTFLLESLEGWTWLKFIEKREKIWVGQSIKSIFKEKFEDLLTISIWILKETPKGRWKSSLTF